MDDPIKCMADKLIVAARILDLVEQSDFDFYTELCSGMSDEEYEELCKEFPEAKDIARNGMVSKHDI